MVNFPDYFHPFLLTFFQLDPTIEDSYRKTIQVDDQTILLDILDTASIEEFSAMRDMYMRGANGFVLVYSVIDQSSFDEIPQIRDQILRVKDTDSFPMILVGTKIDLGDRQVGTVQGQTLARSYNIPFLEVSSKTGTNVGQVFDELAREIQKTQRASAPVYKSKKKAGGFGFALGGGGGGGMEKRKAEKYEKEKKEESKESGRRRPVGKEIDAVMLKSDLELKSASFEMSSREFKKSSGPPRGGAPPRNKVAAPRKAAPARGPPPPSSLMSMASMAPPPSPGSMPMAPPPPPESMPMANMLSGGLKMRRDENEGWEAEDEDERWDAEEEKKEQDDELAEESEEPEEPEATTELILRSNFNPLANFTPSVATNEEGIVKIPFSIPDNLTRYRIWAVAVSGSDLYGLGDNLITARLPLLLRVSPPRFLNYGDSCDLPVVVQNLTEKVLQVKIVIRSRNAKIQGLDQLGFKVEIPSINQNGFLCQKIF